METPKKPCAWRIHALSDVPDERFFHLLDMRRPHNVPITCDFLDQETRDIRAHAK